MNLIMMIKMMSKSKSMSKTQTQTVSTIWVSTVILHRFGYSQANSCNLAQIGAFLLNLTQLRVISRQSTKTHTDLSKLAQIGAIPCRIAQFCTVLRNLTQFHVILRRFVKSCADLRNPQQICVISRRFAQSLAVSRTRAVFCNLAQFCVNFSALGLHIKVVHGSKPMLSSQNFWAALNSSGPKFQFV